MEFISDEEDFVEISANAVSDAVTSADIVISVGMLVCVFAEAPFLSASVVTPSLVNDGITGCSVSDFTKLVSVEAANPLFLFSKYTVSVIPADSVLSTAAVFWGLVSSTNVFSTVF